MYFSKVECRQAAAVAEGYAEHQALHRLFRQPNIAAKTAAENRWLYHRVQTANAVRWYVLSSILPNTDNKDWQVQSKPYAPALREGQQLQFQLRANPVITRKQGERSVRHDVVTDLLKQTPARGTPLPRIQLERQAGLGWLQRQGERHGFHFQATSVHVDGFQRRAMYKPRSNKPISFSTLDFFGVLEVTDAALFGQAVLKGIGPAKGFGCGLLLVRGIG